MTAAEVFVLFGWWRQKRSGEEEQDRSFRLLI